MTPCTPRRIIPTGVATYVEYACLGLSGLGILGFVFYAIKAAAGALAARGCGVSLLSVCCGALSCVSSVCLVG
jgi:hypothetical protein